MILFLKPIEMLYIRKSEICKSSETCGIYVHTSKCMTAQFIYRVFSAWDLFKHGKLKYNIYISKFYAGFNHLFKRV